MIRVCLGNVTTILNCYFKLSFEARLPIRDTRKRDKNCSHLVCFILLFTDHAKTCEIPLHLLTLQFLSRHRVSVNTPVYSK